MKDQERDLLRKCILKLLTKHETLNYTKIEKKVIASCMPFATSNTVWRQLNNYLLACGYVERVRRGIYKITPKGEKLLEILV